MTYELPPGDADAIHDTFVALLLPFIQDAAGIGSNPADALATAKTLSPHLLRWGVREWIETGEITLAQGVALNDQIQTIAVAAIEYVESLVA